MMTNNLRTNFLQLEQEMRLRRESIEQLKDYFYSAKANPNYLPRVETIRKVAQHIGIDSELFYQDPEIFLVSLRRVFQQSDETFNVRTTLIRSNEHIWGDIHKKLKGEWRLYALSAFEQNKYFVSRLTIGRRDVSGIHIDIETPVIRNHGFEKEKVHFHGRIYPVNGFLYVFCERKDKLPVGQMKSFALQISEETIKDNKVIKHLYGHEVFMGDTADGRYQSASRPCFITSQTTKASNLWNLEGTELGFIDEEVVKKNAPIEGIRYLKNLK